MKSSHASYKQTEWSLRDLYPGADSPELQASWDQVETMVTEFEIWRDRLNPDMSAQDFLEMIRDIEAMTLKLHEIYGFAGLRFAEDTQNQEAQAFLARVQKFAADVKNRVLFFDLWWKGLVEQDAERLMAGAGDYRYWLEEMRHFTPYTLSEPEEKVINVKDVTGISALQTLYDSITNRYVFELEVEGEKKELTRDGLSVYVRHADPDVRARAYQEMFRVYQQDAPILGQIYQTLVRDLRNEQIDLRQFESPIEVRNLANDLPNEVVETLLEVSKGNVEVFRRFFRLKAKWIGMDRIRRYDIYAPIAEAEKKYDFDTAVDMVLDAFARFDVGMADMARRVLDEVHLDSEVRKGKRGGAFCWTVSPQLTPWVLANFQGRARDVATLAHELGHAVHSMLASQHSVLDFHPALPLAETASTFGEMLLVDQLLSEEQDTSVRGDILLEQVDDAYATILRQAFFALFEMEAHDMVHKGASVDKLADAYLSNLKAQFGESVEISPEFRWEWVAIPHMYHVPFYVYAYAFGQLLVLSLYQQYTAEGESFKPRYLKILAAGGSKSPDSILKDAGIDIREPAFWQGGFDFVNDLVDKLASIQVD